MNPYIIQPGHSGYQYHCPAPSKSIRELKTLYGASSTEYNRLRDTFSSVLRRLRMQKGISQEELAVRCGLDRVFISMLECGKRAPSLFTVYKISKALNIPLLVFIGAIEQQL